MNKIDTTIHIVIFSGPDEYPEDFDPKRYGMNFSTAERLKVNKTPSGYSIVMSSLEFMMVENSKLLSSLIRLLSANVPDTIFTLSVELYDDLLTGREMPIYEKAKAMNKLMYDIASSGRMPTIGYNESMSIDDEDDSPVGNYDEDYDEDDDDDEEEYTDADVFSSLGFLKDKKKEKKSKEYYGRSRVWRNAKNAKRDVNRHGVIVASDKDDLEKDTKIVKEFLKDFLPGDAGWKKEFRKELAKRWIKVFAITKKKLKGYEKEFRNQSNKKRLNKGISAGLSMMNRMVNSPLDRWSDPSK